MQQPLTPREFRRRAIDALKPAFSIALMIFFIAALPGILAGVARTVTGQAFSVAMGDLMTELEYAADISLDTVTRHLDRILSTVTPAYITATIVELLIALLVAPVLELGASAAMLRLLRKEEIGPLDVFCRLNVALKAIGLNLFILLRIGLWALPGIGVCAVTALLQALLNLPFFFMPYYLGFMLSAVLSLREALRLALSTCFLADSPREGILAVTRRSRTVMRYRTIPFLALRMFFMVLSTAGQLISTLLASESLVLGNTLNMALGLLVTMLCTTSICAFYQEFRDKPGRPVVRVVIRPNPSAKSPVSKDDALDADDPAGDADPTDTPAKADRPWYDAPDTAADKPEDIDGAER